MGIEVNTKEIQHCESITIPIKINRLITNVNVLEQEKIDEERTRLESRTLRMLKKIRKYSRELGEQVNPSSNQISEMRVQSNGIPQIYDVFLLVLLLIKIIKTSDSINFSVQLNIAKETFRDKPNADYVDEAEAKSYAQSISKIITNNSKLSSWMIEDDELVFPIDL